MHGNQLKLLAISLIMILILGISGVLASEYVPAPETQAPDDFVEAKTNSSGFGFGLLGLGGIFAVISLIIIVQPLKPGNLAP